MQAPLLVRTKLTAPMVLAALILVGGFVAIAWTVQWATSGGSQRIEQATQAGASAVALPIANRVNDALPAFSLDLDGVTAYQPPRVAPWTDAKALDRQTVDGLTFVWLDGWWMCMFITDDYEYEPTGFNDANPQDAIDMARWQALTFRQQQNIKKECDR